MRKFAYNEPIFSEDGSIFGNRVIEFTEEQIRETYFPFWKAKMEKKYGVDHFYINFDTCVEDWITVNWAWEISEDEL